MSATAPATEPTEAALVEKARTGDESAYRWLVKRHEQRLFAVVSRLIPRSEDVAEVCQDAFVKAYFALSDFRGDAQFGTWITGIAINLARNRYRDSQRKGRNMGTSIDRLAADAPAIADAALASHITPRDLAGHDETAEALEECLSALDSAFREAFVLRVHDDMNYNEIAEALSIPVGTVKSRLNSARRSLRKCLESKSVLSHD